MPPSEIIITHDSESKLINIACVYEEDGNAGGMTGAVLTYDQARNLREEIGRLLMYIPDNV